MIKEMYKIYYYICDKRIDFWFFASVGFLLFILGLFDLKMDTYGYTSIYMNSGIMCLGFAYIIGRINFNKRR